jgi:hypothetical protein
MIKVKVSELSGPALDIRHITRKTYGADAQEAPNDHCYWDPDWGLWTENDAHLRERIKKLSSST